MPWSSRNYVLSQSCQRMTNKRGYNSLKIMKIWHWKTGKNFDRSNVFRCLLWQYNFGLTNMKVWFLFALHLHFILLPGRLMCVIFSLHTLGLLIPIKYRLNTASLLDIDGEQISQLMTTACSFTVGQQENTACHKKNIMADLFMEHGNEFLVLKWSLQSTGSHFWRACLGCDGKEDSYPEYVVNQSRMYSNEGFQNLVENYDHEYRNS